MPLKTSLPPFLIAALLMFSMDIGYAQVPKPKLRSPQSTIATVKVHGITMCSQVDADFHPMNRVKTFAISDTIWAVVQVTCKDTAEVQADWYHTSSDQHITSNAVELEPGEHELPFFIAKPDGWPSGDYSVDIVVKGKVLKSAGFDVPETEED